MAQKELPLKFEQIRTFGKVFSDTRLLIRENFAVFFKAILFLVGPFALFTCTIHTFYQVNIIGDNGGDWSHIGSYVAAATIYTQLRWLLNGLLTAVVVSHFIKVYREKGPGKFDVNDITKSILRDFGGSLLTALLMLIIVSVLSIAIAGLIFGVAKLSPAGGIFLLVLGYIGYFLIRFPFWYFVYGVFHARFAEPGRKNPFSAMSLHGKTFSGNWWFTWVVFFGMWAMLTALGYIVSLPAEALSIASGIYDIDPTRNKDVDWKLVESILTSIGEFARTLIYSVFSAAIALHFYSLKEKQDGKGTLELLEQIGKTKDDDHIELTY
jgi:hypothetical protein